MEVLRIVVKKFGPKFTVINPLSASVILIYKPVLTGFYVRATPALNGLSHQTRRDFCFRHQTQFDYR